MESEKLVKIEEQLKRQEEKIDAMYKSVEKLRKYFTWTFIITIVMFVLPLIGIAFALPSFFSNYVGSLNGSALGL